MECSRCHGKSPITGSVTVFTKSGEFKEWICGECSLKTEPRPVKRGGIYAIRVEEKAAVCFYCGKKYKKKAASQKFCSKECYYKNYKDISILDLL